MERKRTFAEIGRIEAVRQLFEGSGYEPFGEPLWFNAKAGDCVTTSGKTFQEGVDFDLVYFPLKHLGYKCVIAVTGELYAVMAHPMTLSVTLGISAKLDFDQISELWGGMVSAAKEHGYKSISLDLQPSRNGLNISVSSTGSHSKLSSARRSEARSKDLVCVSGSLGAAYIGLQILEREKIRFESGAQQSDALEKNRMLVGSYLKPELNAALVSQLEDSQIYPSFGYFVNRGLSDAILRLNRDSGLGVKIYADRIPFEGNTFSMGKELNIDPVSAAMNGGEDCRILFTVPILQLDKFRKDFQTFDIIGHLALPEAGTVMVTPDGLEHPLTAQGW